MATADQLQLLSPAMIHALEKAAERLRRLGAELVEIDIEPFLRSGELLYDGAFVAERYAAVGEFIATHPGAVDPTVAAIILGAKPISAQTYLSDLERLDEHRLVAREA